MSYRSEIIDKAISLLKEGLSIRRVSTELRGIFGVNIPKSTIHDWKKAAESTVEDTGRHGAFLTPFDIPLTTGVDYKDVLAACMKIQQDRIALRGPQFRKIRRKIETKTPIALVCLSDIHLGSPNTDYRALHNDLERLERDPRFFILKGGDWADKFMPSFKTAAAVTGQVLPATDQLLTLDLIVKAFDGRIIASIDGNHDQMDARSTGIDTNMLVARGSGIPSMPTGGLIELEVGDQAYRILWSHQYGTGNSQVNKFNVFRWFRAVDSQGIPDVAILEHHHDPGIMSQVVGGFGEYRTTVDIRTGSYKIDDRYSTQFFKEGVPAPQSVILFPDCHKVAAMHGSDGIEDAQYYLDGVAMRGR